VDFLKTIDKRSNTIRNYGTNKRVICGFARERYGQLVTIKNINLGFVRELRKYLKNDRKNENGTIEKRLEGLRAAIRYAIHEGYTIDDPFNRYNNLIPAGGHKTVFLDADEYKGFRTLKLPVDSNRSMKLSHKMFTFSCETGLRYSDMQDLKWEHLIENNGRYEALEKTQIKTRNHVHVPLSNQALAIIMMNGHNRTGEYVFDRIENQTINDCLKILAADAGITKNLTYHVSRHTFATNLANNGANEFEIAQLLGDKKLDMARIYVNNDAKGLKNTMNRVWSNMKKTS
jgi:site-specific recombinase XerD